MVTEGNPFDQYNELQAYDCKISNGQVQVSYKDPSDLNPQQLTLETIMLPKDLTETEQERYLQKMMKMQANHEDKLDKGKDRLERRLLKFSNKMEMKALRNQERSLRREMQDQGVTEGGETEGNPQKRSTSLYNWRSRIEKPKKEKLNNEEEKKETEGRPKREKRDKTEKREKRSVSSYNMRKQFY